MDLKNLNKDRAKGRRKSSIDLSTMVYGKVPPQAKDLEEAVLGAIMLEKSAFDVAAEILKPECFYIDAHQRLFRVMQGLQQKNQPIDILTVVEELKSKEDLEAVGGPYFVTRLTNSVVSSANIEAHSKIIYQKYLQREIIRIGGEMINDSYEDSTDVFDLLNDAESKLSMLSIHKQLHPYTDFKSVAVEAVQEIYARKTSESELTGVPTGLHVLDLVTQGWQPTNFIVIAARPAVGKSAVAGNLAYNAATHPEKPTPVGIFSLEMSSKQWVNRILSFNSEIGLFDLKRGRISDDQMTSLSSFAFNSENIKIYFCDTANLDIYQLKSKARSMVLKDKVGLIIVDYLQLISGTRAFNENREQEISKISRELKQLAKELNIPVIALSQLSRQGDNPNPKLSNIRESGAIEQDADDVIFLIEVPEDEVKSDPRLKDSILLRIAKHRNGIQQDVPVKFVKNIQKIMSEAEYEQFMSKKENPKTGWQPLTQASLLPESNPNQFIEPRRVDSTGDMPF